MANNHESFWGPVDQNTLRQQIEEGTDEYVADMSWKKIYLLSRCQSAGDIGFKCVL